MPVPKRHELLCFAFLWEFVLIIFVKGERGFLGLQEFVQSLLLGGVPQCIFINVGRDALHIFPRIIGATFFLVLTDSMHKFT